MHPLLKRQLRKLNLDPNTLPLTETSWQALLARIEKTYVEADQGRERIERALSLSSQEMQDLYESLRQASETLLQGEKEHTRLIVDNALDAIVSMNSDGLITGWNPTAEHIFGWSREEAIDQPLANLIIPHAHRENYTAGLKRFLATGNGSIFKKRIELPALHQQGHEFPIELYIMPLFKDGSFTFSSFIRDITDRKKAEELVNRLAQFPRDNPNPVLELNLSGHILYLNPAAEQCFPDLGLQTNFHPLLADYKSIATAVEQGPQHWLVRELEIGNRIFSQKITYIAENKIIRFYLHDISDHKNAEKRISKAARELKVTNRELAVARDQALEAARLKAEFVATMSHEIRTPMNGILGFTDILLDTQLTPFQRDAADTLRVSANHLLTILNDILDFSKVEAGKLRLEPIDFDLRALLNEALDLLDALASSKNVTMVTNIPTHVPQTLQGDPNRLRQVLTNLVGNAIKFTEQGEVGIHVHVNEDDANFCMLKFEITDTGIGISSEMQNCLFRPFTQADSSTTRKYGGTGLGLAICKQLVELMGGRIGVESNLGQGSCFWFTIKLHKPSQPHTNSPPPLTGHRSQESAHLESARILVVDDYAINQKLALLMLEQQGHQVDVAENGKEAIKAWQEVPYQLIFMDCHMPKMDGYAATQEIRRLEDPSKHTPIIAMTANALKGDEEKCLNAGMDDYLMKPIRPEQVKKLLYKWLPHTSSHAARSTFMTDRSPVSNDPQQSPVDQTAWNRIEALQRPNRPDVLSEFLTIFLNDSPLQLDSLQLALKQNDPATIFHAAHTLKSSSAFLGAHRLSELCKELELMGRNNSLEGAASTFKNLQEEYAVVSNFLTEHLNRKSPS